MLFTQNDELNGAVTPSQWTDQSKKPNVSLHLNLNVVKQQGQVQKLASDTQSHSNYNNSNKEFSDDEFNMKPNNIENCNYWDNVVMHDIEDDSLPQECDRDSSADLHEQIRRHSSRSPRRYKQRHSDASNELKSIS